MAAIPKLYLVAARSLFGSEAAWLRAVADVHAAASRILALPIAIQVRIEPEHSEATRLAVAALDTIGGARAVPLFLNAAGVDAAALGYDAVHWPEQRIPAAPLASAIPCAASVHSMSALRRAEAVGVRFALFGAVWAPTWKVARVAGVEELRALCAASTIPLLAIGGVTPERVPECLRAGSAGVAVASGVFRAASPAQALRDYARALCA
ncbi:MAG: thiamine phosphate synthase [Candidatus Latescibacterota bacterium]|nr:MAG: thiamine phosphate synthase [Candidatus Latescibacterota bacterium]